MTERKKIALFLGAGASVPYGLPTTKQFLDNLRESDLMDNNILKSLVDCPQFTDIEHVLQAIKDVINFQHTHGGLFYSWMSSNSGINIAMKPVPIIYEQFNTELIQVRQLLHDVILTKYQLNDEQALIPLGQTLSPILNFMMKYSDKINVFTTNYDGTIEEFIRHSNLYRLVDGFRPDNNQEFVFEPSIFEDEFDSEPSPIFLYKLHGSLNWVKRRHTILRISVEQKLDPAKYTNLIVYPTLSPKGDSDQMPYKFLFKRFEFTMDETDILIVVGFSFRDKEITDKIREQFVKEKKRLIIISPSGAYDYYHNLVGEEMPSESTQQEFMPNDYTLILNQKLNEITSGAIFNRIEGFCFPDE